MPTRRRIDIAGYHHIMNRGVDQMDIFRYSEDKKGTGVENLLFLFQGNGTSLKVKGLLTKTNFLLIL